MSVRKFLALCVVFLAVMVYASLPLFETPVAAGECCNLGEDCTGLLECCDPTGRHCSATQDGYCHGTCTQ